MTFYVSIGTIMDYIAAFHKRTGRDAEFLKIIETIYHDGAYITNKPAPPDRAHLSSIDATAFATEIRDLYYPFQSELILGGNDYNYFDPKRDVTTLTQFWGTLRKPVINEVFFLNYVVFGQAQFQFQDENMTLDKGTFLIVSPPSKDYTVRPMTSDSLLIPIDVQKSTFSQVFFSVLSANDILSFYFHKLLEDPDQPSYIVFQTHDNPIIELLVRQIFLENFEYDNFVNRSDIYWLNLIFTNVLRYYKTYIQSSSDSKGPNYAPILKYIECKYHTITLKQLSEKFGYTAAHLSKVIRAYTGCTFSELLRNMKMEEAAKLLIETGESIESISIQTGFNSPDHFTRTFKKHFRMAPSEYRKKRNELNFNECS